MAKTPKTKPASEAATATIDTVVASAADPAVPAPLPTLSPEALKQRADEWDAAREALKTSGEAAAAAQAAFNALANDATDEQRDDALRLLAEAENAVKDAEATIRRLSEPLAFAIEGAAKRVMVTADENGLALSLAADDGDDDAVFSVHPIFAEIDTLVAADNIAAAVERLKGELAVVDEIVREFEEYRGKLSARLELLHVGAEPFAPVEERLEDKGLVRVTGPTAGRWRAGRFWGGEAVEVKIDPETYKALTEDPAFIVEIID